MGRGREHPGAPLGRPGIERASPWVSVWGPISMPARQCGWNGLGPPMGRRDGALGRRRAGGDVPEDWGREGRRLEGPPSRSSRSRGESASRGRPRADCRHPQVPYDSGDPPNWNELPAGTAAIVTLRQSLERPQEPGVDTVQPTVRPDIFMVSSRRTTPPPLTLAGPGGVRVRLLEITPTWGARKRDPGVGGERRALIPSAAIPSSSPTTAILAPAIATPPPLWWPPDA